MGPYELLEVMVRIFEKLRIPYFVTGSVAAMAYGEPRLTNDIDIVTGMEAAHISGLLAELPSDQFYVSEDMIRDAIRRRTQFNIIHPASGLKMDIVIRDQCPYNESRFRRIRRIKPGEGYEANFASPEDIIIMKMRYYKEGGSDKHLRDIAGILKISGAEIDRAYIHDWAIQLGVLEIWDRVIQALESPDNRQMY
jgi:hypothetical protein